MTAGMDHETAAGAAAENRAPGASLEHLTGPARGTLTWLVSTPLDICTPGRHILHVAAAQQCGGRTQLARLHPAADSFEIQAAADSPLWINRNRVTAHTLAHGDLIDFGDHGPMCRFALHAGGKPLRKTLPDIVSDCADYLRGSRKPLLHKFARAGRNMGASLTRQTTRFFRLGVVGALAALAAVAFYEFQSSRQLGRHLQQAATRIQALERQSDAVREVIQAAARSVVLLQGAYGHRETATGRMLRQAVDGDGRPLRLPLGQPMLTLEGDGPVAENHFTGTAFVLGADAASAGGALGGGVLLTNRHVARPWEQDPRRESLAQRGLEPVMLAFHGYAPDAAAAFAVEVAAVSEAADLAALQTPAPLEFERGLALGAAPPAPGEQVLVMGYPTGLRSLLARAGAQFLEQFESDRAVDFQQVADELARKGHIRPLASLGIVAQVSAAAVVYDADTAHGGSGGPVLNMAGEVVAVNAAIIPGYTGSNIGVPAKFVEDLLEQVGGAD